MARTAAALQVLASWVASPPTAESLAVVRQQQWLDGWPMEHTHVCRAGLDLLAKSAAEGEEEAAIRADHAGLVGGPGRVAVHPYESVHRSAEGLLFDEQTLEVRACYAEFGLAAPHRNRAPDDHLALELEFVSTLASRWIDAEGTSERERIADGIDGFLQLHLFQWAPHFFDALGRAAGTHFYHGVALLGVDTLVQMGAGTRESPAA